MRLLTGGLERTEMAQVLEAPVACARPEEIDDERTLVDDYARTIEIINGSLTDLPDLPFGHILNDRFQVIKQLGKGGIGSVYLCLDLKTDSRVALKVSNYRETSEHLAAESETLTQLGCSRPNIVNCLAAGADFIVMEYIEGESLKSVIHSISASERAEHYTDHAIAALRIIREVLIGLEFAHNRGHVHADLSPDNIMLRNGLTDHNVTIIDWGLGRSYNQRIPGTLMGKIGYMAPEQARSEDIDGRADVYSAGLLLYEMLTGSRPYQSLLDRELLVARERGVAFNRQVLQRWFENLDQSLCASITNLLLRMTAARRDENDEDSGPTRFQSAFDARLAVERILQDIEVAQSG
ncbi:MAG: serine/threonine protein kinase [Candidatus Saganbacteria bacterium]|nr:serine/threonine protein kinase [Candidatus Saganbacteria bacterium]